MLSPTMKVLPSGVMTEPFGKPRSSAATRAVPSGSTAITHVVRGDSPAYMSNPKFPT